MEKKLYVKTADGSVWEVEKEFPKYYQVKSKFNRLLVYKRSVVATFTKGEKNL